MRRQIYCGAISGQNTSPINISWEGAESHTLPVLQLQLCSLSGPRWVPSPHLPATRPEAPRDDPKESHDWDCLQQEHLNSLVPLAKHPLCVMELGSSLLGVSLRSFMCCISSWDTCQADNRCKPVEPQIGKDRRFISTASSLCVLWTFCKANTLCLRFCLSVGCSSFFAELVSCLLMTFMNSVCS